VLQDSFIQNELPNNFPKLCNNGFVCTDQMAEDLQRVRRQESSKNKLFHKCIYFYCFGSGVIDAMVFLIGLHELTVPEQFLQKAGEVPW
jgi:hypothetical protein